MEALDQDRKGGISVFCAVTQNEFTICVAFDGAV